MTGGGMNNRYRHWNARSAFEEMMPHGNTFRCDTGFGPGHVTCYNQHCKTTVGSLQCTTRSTYFAGSGVRVATLPGGYTMTGGGIYNHYRHFNQHSGFEESFPHGNNGWRGDMGFGWGQYTVYVRGCRSTVGRLSCVTRHTGVANYHSVDCPGGYKLTGCGINNHYRHWNHLSGFEASFPKSNTQCDCDTGFGTGRNTCYARCCKVVTPKPKRLASCTSNAKKSIQSVIHEVKNAQGILNRMDNGARCKNKGANLVKSAKNALARSPWRSRPR